MKNKNKTTPTAIKITDKAKGNMFVGCDVRGAVEIEKEATNNKFIDTNIETTSSKSDKQPWYKQLFWQAVATAGSLLVAYLVYKFGWK